MLRRHDNRVGFAGVFQVFVILSAGYAASGRMLPAKTLPPITRRCPGLEVQSHLQSCQGL
jgi:hypothetical protein